MAYNINKHKIDDMIRNLTGYPDIPVMKHILETAKQNDVPIIRPESAALLDVTVRMKKPDKALEIGTGIGCSSVVILNASDCELATIELSEENLSTAREMLSEAGYNKRYTAYCGDVMDILPNMTGRYDFIYMDGPKAQYIRLLPDILRLLAMDGVLVCDDVLFYGMVADKSLLNRRKITIVKRMKEFLNDICCRPELSTSILPIGNGMTVSIKKEVCNDEE